MLFFFSLFERRAARYIMYNVYNGERTRWGTINPYSQTLVRDAIDSAAFFYSRMQSLATVYDRDINSKKHVSWLFSLREERRRSKQQHKKTYYARPGARVGRKWLWMRFLRRSHHSLEHIKNAGRFRRIYVYYATHTHTHTHQTDESYTVAIFY